MMEWHQDIGSIHLGVCLTAGETPQLGKDRPSPPDGRSRFDLHGIARKPDLIYCHDLGCSDQVQGCPAGTLRHHQSHDLHTVLSLFLFLDPLFHCPCTSHLCASLLPDKLITFPTHRFSYSCI